MSETLAAWVPPSVLAGIVIAVFGFWFTKLDRLLEKIVSRLEALERASNTYATLDQVGRLGDRFDGRVTNVTERVAILEALGKR